MDGCSCDSGQTKKKKTRRDIIILRLVARVHSSGTPERNDLQTGVAV